MVGGAKKVGVSKKNEGVEVEGYNPHNTPLRYTLKKRYKPYYD